MTKQELLKIINEKKELVEKELKIATYNRQFKDVIFRDNHTAREDNLLGEIKAYNEVLCLIESSGELDENN